MTRLFIDVGRNGRVGPSDIVGAIANEGGRPKAPAIGRKNRAKSPKR